MQHILSLEGKFIMGTPKEIVIGMKNNNVFTESQPKLEYMELAAARVQMMYGYEIRHGDAADFLADLDSHGLIKLSSMQ